MAKTDAPLLSEQMCFDLYVASRAMTNSYRPALTELGLTYPQYLVLLVLFEQGTSTVKELADVLKLDHGTMTPLLRRMEDNGLVLRRRAAADERFVQVTLTGKGSSMREDARKIHCDMKEVLGLDRDEYTALQETLRTLAARVSQG